MTTLIDHGYLSGHIGSIHPMDKTPVGKRLMLAALEHAYGADVVSTGPAPRAASLSGDGTHITLTFDPSTVGPAGLLLRLSGAVRQQCAAGQRQLVGNPQSPIPPSQCGSATGFEVGVDAGADTGVAWHAVDTMALAAGKGALLLRVPTPLTPQRRGQGLQLRYLFADWPTPTVYNSESFLGTNGELPTPPFVMPVR